MMNETQATKWYDRTWLVVLLCIFLFPVGLYAIWKSKFAIGWKIGYTALVAIILIVPKPDPKDQPKTEITSAVPVQSAHVEVALTQHQKDSISKVEKAAELDAYKKNMITAEDLVQHYVNNEVRADGLFKGNRFNVEGTISNIGKDITGSIYITLDGPGHDFRNVQCYVDDPAFAAQLDKGTTVAILGTCNGLMVNVHMKDCKFVKGSWALEEELAAMP